VLPKALPGMLERAVNDGAPFEGERGQVALDSIGDAVMSNDSRGPAQPHGVGDPGREDRSPHSELCPDPARLHGNGSSRLRKQSSGKFTAPD
jgi:hypothetical protein